MIYKEQSVSISTGLFAKKLLVEKAEFSYSSNTQEYSTLCGPKNTATLLVDEDATLNLSADTSTELHDVYVAGFGSYYSSTSFSVFSRVGDLLQVSSPINVGSILQVTDGTNTAIVYVREATIDSVLVEPSLSFTPISGLVKNTYRTDASIVVLLKALEQFNEQSYEHLNMSCDTLRLHYSLDDNIMTSAKLHGTEKVEISGVTLTETSVMPKPSKKCKIRIGGIPNDIKDVVIVIDNVFTKYTCMSGEFLGKILVDKVITGEFRIAGSYKQLQPTYLMIYDNSVVYAPVIRIDSLIEEFDDSGVYTKAIFTVVDAEVSLAF